MEKRVSMLLLLMAVFVLSDVADRKATARVTLSGIDRKLNLLNKPAVKSIKSEDGDIIDCVDINKQPAFDHPALRNHKIQMMPSFDQPTEKIDTRNESSQPVIQQTWQKSGSLSGGNSSNSQNPLQAAACCMHMTEIYSCCCCLTFLDLLTRLFSLNQSAIQVTVGYNYIGAQGDINVWNPTVDLPDDYTTGQIWLKAGPGDNFESVEAGWVVNPKLYGDHAT
ncbi:hypothetical protein LWI28_010909 [Acer negundo]|uniref:Neprosin PEP catalytic domain-containing protein n=1 Tax=Acer negundo TaxID=4023 RepID=A0AAD5J9N0_ACENE|nr:hypothetical protein LWI28_010909 [Acer negundo]